MKTKRWIWILVGILAGSILPATISILIGLFEKRNFSECLKIFGLITFVEVASVAIVVWCISRAEREGKKWINQLKEEGYSPIEIEILSLERQRERLSVERFCGKQGRESLFDIDAYLDESPYQDKLLNIEAKIEYLREQQRMHDQ